MTQKQHIITKFSSPVSTYTHKIFHLGAVGGGKPLWGACPPGHPLKPPVGVVRTPRIRQFSLYASSTVQAQCSSHLHLNHSSPWQRRATAADDVRDGIMTGLVFNIDERARRRRRYTGGARRGKESQNAPHCRNIKVTRKQRENCSRSI